jgi:hypothetical protein
VLINAIQRFGILKCYILLKIFGMIARKLEHKLNFYMFLKIHNGFSGFTF